jgi:hypothetical protein
MNLIELPGTLAERVSCLIRPVVPLNDVADEATGSRNPNLLSRWQPVLTRLADWKSNPQQVADEGVFAPPVELVKCAEDVAEALCTQCVEPPDQVLTNGDGGIVFRWRLPGRTWSVEMDVDGSIESSLMAGSSLLWRHSIHEHPAKAS